MSSLVRGRVFTVSVDGVTYAHCSCGWSAGPEGRRASAESVAVAHAAVRHGLTVRVRS